MSRGLFLAWLWRHRIEPAAVPRLTFDTPISSYTEAARRAWLDRLEQSSGQGEGHRDEAMRLEIWTLAGKVFTHNRRQSPEVRREARRCLVLLRRAWAAHATGRVDLARAEYAGARDAWLCDSAEVLGAAAYAEWRRQFDAVVYGKRGGRPRKEDQAAEWMRRYDRMRATRRMLTAKECYEDIAADDLGDPAKWQTVKNRISEYRNRPKKGGFP